MIFKARDIFFSSLAGAANRLLALDKEASDELAITGVTVISCGSRGGGHADGANLMFAHGELQIAAYAPELADVSLYGGPVQVLRYMFSDDGGDDALGSAYLSAVEVEGDEAAAAEIFKICRGLQLDWEEPASKVLGDTGAYMLGRLVGDVGDWLRGTRRLVHERASEYIAYEADVVITRPEMDAFSGDLSEVARRTDGLANRLDALSRRHREPR
ncbi:MAG: hypothetical protein K0U93_15725 [Gammaproteobacteria bacterium]|nr:hypothetical protein [Gammaproteobacteria bacterium]